MRGNQYPNQEAAVGVSLLTFTHFLFTSCRKIIGLLQPFLRINGIVIAFGLLYDFE
jgi:hypothetical protein